MGMNTYLLFKFLKVELLGQELHDSVIVFTFSFWYIPQTLM